MESNTPSFDHNQSPMAIIGMRHKLLLQIARYISATLAMVDDYSIKFAVLSDGFFLTAQLTNKEPTWSGVDVALRPPETIIETSYDTKVDVWMIGCAVRKFDSNCRLEYDHLTLLVI